MDDLILLISAADLLEILSSEVEPARKLLASGKDYAVSVESRGGMLAITWREMKTIPPLTVSRA